MTVKKVIPRFESVGKIRCCGPPSVRFVLKDTATAAGSGWTG